MKGRNHGNYTNPCLTMHQPWASLLVYGIKRIEGRSWPAPIRGRLWIHAAGKVPEEATIKAMEEFYREIYAVNGVTDLKFPEHYPVSRLIGCIEVVGCLKGEELAAWDRVPEGVRLEAQTDFCWLCERPQRLIVPFEMRGFQRVYNLEKKIYDAAVRGLSAVESPFPVEFPLPNPRDPFSLKPGSLVLHYPEPKAVELDKSSSLTAAIAGARAAATQFSKKDHISYNRGSYSLRANRPESSSLIEAEMMTTTSGKISVAETSVSESRQQTRTLTVETSSPLKEAETTSSNFGKISVAETSASESRQQTRPLTDETSNNYGQPFRAEQRPRPVVASKIFAAAMRGLKPS